LINEYFESRGLSPFDSTLYNSLQDGKLLLSRRKDFTAWVRGVAYAPKGRAARGGILLALMARRYAGPMALANADFFNRFQHLARVWQSGIYHSRVRCRLRRGCWQVRGPNIAKSVFTIIDEFVKAIQQIR
jgi:hypothetical protein